MAVTFNDYMPTIWNTLMAAINNEIGVAALMGNLYAESGCTPYACQPSRPYNVCMTYIGKVDRHEINETGFVYHGCSSAGGIASGKGGFGLAQWTEPSRKQNLYTYWTTQGGSIGDLGLQLRFLISELQNSFPDVWTALTTATDITTASNFVLFNFENPRDKSQSVQDTRVGYSTVIYNTYAGTTPTPVPTPTPSPLDPPSPEPQPPLIHYPKKSIPIWMYPLLRK